MMIRDQIYKSRGYRNIAKYMILLMETRMRGESSGKIAQKLGADATVDHDPVLKAIRRIIHAVDSRSKKVARTTGLTIPQIVILRAVRDLGEVPTNQISAQADLTAATVVTILDKLEEKGLVARRRSTEDRRIVYTQLTSHGLETVAAAPPLVSDSFVEAFARMPASRRRRLVSALTEVAGLFATSEHQPSNVTDSKGSGKQ
jgi:DNA-binding MarR family transcriptional regulator